MMLCQLKIFSTSHPGLNIQLSHRSSKILAGPKDSIRFHIWNRVSDTEIGGAQDEFKYLL